MGFLLVFLSLNSGTDAFNKCFYYVKEWMATNRLKINSDKTLWLKKHRDRLKACFAIDILGSLVCPTESVKDLVVWFRL